MSDIAFEERFWSKVDASASCWVWTAASAGQGYGKYSVSADGKTKYPLAHRYSYELLVGPTPEGMELDHLCKNRKCVNPDHLEPTTRKVNNLRSGSPTSINSRKTHCANGHEYTDENTRHSSNGRACRTCHRAWDKERRNA